MSSYKMIEHSFAKTKDEINNLAWLLKESIRTSDWYREFYEKAMNSKEIHLNDIIYDFKQNTLTDEFYDTDFRNCLIIEYGSFLEELREARRKRLANQND